MHLSLDLLGSHHQCSKILDGKWGYHRTNVSTETILKFPTSPLFIEWHRVESAEVFELLSILSYRLPSLGQLKKLHLFRISDVVWEIFREELPPEGPPSNRFLSLFHDGFHADPPMLCLSCKHIHCESQSVLHNTHLGVEYSLHVVQPLVCDIRTSLTVEFH